MSSYQFVNTLAQCYAEQTAAQQASQVGQEYYNMNYPNCYSPNLTNHSGYGQYSLMMSGQAAAAMAAGMADYGVTGGSGGLPSASASGSLTNSLSQTGHRRSANQSPTAVINQISSSSNNCKYSDSSVGGSPQDLRTSSAGGTPQPSGPNKPSSSPPISQSPVSPMTSSATAAALAAVAAHQSSGGQSGSKGSSSTNASTSGGGRSGGNSGGGGGDGDGKSPPQIYPWMKRVHLGQSK